MFKSRSNVNIIFENNNFCNLFEYLLNYFIKTCVKVTIQPAMCVLVDKHWTSFKREWINGSACENNATVCQSTKVNALGDKNEGWRTTTLSDYS